MLQRMKPLLVAVLLTLILVLPACSSNRNRTVLSEKDIVLTDVVKTVNAQLTEIGPRTAEPTTTPYATRTMTVEPSATRPGLPSLQPTAAATATAPGSPDVAEWVSQSPADYSILAPGTPFKMTWTIRNVGKSTWTRAYQLRFFANSQLGAPAAVNFSKDVPPGDTIDLSVDMVAPTTPGDYHSLWVLTSDKTGNFYPVDIHIKVSPAAATQTPSPTPLPAATNTATTEADE
jgi:hypothetical protein